MYSVLIILHLLVCIALAIVILLQSSKGGGLAGVFGGGGMGAVFGGRGAASFLAKVTAILATLFLSISLILGLITRGTTSKNASLVGQEREKRQVSSPASVLPTPAGEFPAGQLPSLPGQEGALQGVDASAPVTPDSTK